MSAQGQSLGQVNRQRERAGSPVGQPANLTEFLEDMGLGEYSRVLGENEIDLEAVHLMADSDFQDIGACGLCLCAGVKGRLLGWQGVTGASLPHDTDNDLLIFTLYFEMHLLTIDMLITDFALS